MERCARQSSAGISASVNKVSTVDIDTGKTNGRLTT